MPSATALPFLAIFAAFLNRRVHAQAVFGSTVLLGGWWDLRPGVDGPDAPSRCEAAVDRAADLGITHLSFVPTTYWMDKGPLDPPAGFDPLCSDLDLAGYYCYNRFDATSMSHWCLAKTPEDLISHSCEELTTSAQRVWQLLLTQCLSRAVDRGIESIELNLRVDDGRTLHGWRNTLDFSPTTLYGNYSYETAFIQPLVDVMSVFPYDVELALTVAGEMGATTTLYSSEWIGVVERARSQLVEARPQGAIPVKIGIQLNGSKICGCFQVEYTGSYEDYIRSFEEEFIPADVGIDLEAFKELLASVDYLGGVYFCCADPLSRAHVLVHPSTSVCLPARGRPDVD